MLVPNDFKTVNVNSSEGTEDVPLKLLKQESGSRQTQTEKHRQKTGAVNAGDEKTARRQSSPVRQTRRSEVFDFKGGSVKNSTAEP